MKYLAVLALFAGVTYLQVQAGSTLGGALLGSAVVFLFGLVISK